MEMNYIITIDTKQKIDGDEENIQVITHASFSGSKDDYTLVYTEESQESGESKTELRCEKGEKITVVRFGEGMTTNLMLEKGMRHASCHATPYGTFSMGVVALDIYSDIDENGGKLHFMYATDIENTPLGEITFDITLRPKNLNREEV